MPVKKTYRVPLLKCRNQLKVPARLEADHFAGSPSPSPLVTGKLTPHPSILYPTAERPRTMRSTLIDLLQDHASPPIFRGSPSKFELQISETRRLGTCRTGGMLPLVRRRRLVSWTFGRECRMRRFTLAHLQYIEARLVEHGMRHEL